MILWHTLAGRVEMPEIFLRTGVTSLGSFGVPLRSFGIILREAHAVMIELTKKKLGDLVILLGGRSIPLRSLGVVLGNSASQIVHEPEPDLRRCMSSLGQRTQQFECRCIILPHVGSSTIFVGLSCHWQSQAQHQNERGENRAARVFHL